MKYSFYHIILGYARVELRVTIQVVVVYFRSLHHLLLIILWSGSIKPRRQCYGMWSFRIYQKHTLQKQNKIHNTTVVGARTVGTDRGGVLL